MAADPDAFVELRMEVPRTVIDVFDAVSTSRRMKRPELVLEVLTASAEQWMREATAILRVTKMDERERGR